MKRLFISAFALFAASIMVNADSKSFKRGFGENTLYYAEDLQALLPGNSWFYTWGDAPNGNVLPYVGKDKGIEFVPMAWNGNFNTAQLKAYYDAHPNDRFLLGFNEPNFPDQASMLPTEAAEKWREVEQFAKENNLTLVGPAMNYAGSPLKDGKVWGPYEWMDAFIDAYKQKYGTEPHYDYTAVHAYMNSPEAVMGLVNGFAEKYGKKVWLTEFCSWEGTVTAETQQASMIAKLKLLETSDNVYRYAWFKARNADKYPFYNLLYYPTKTIKQGTLTELGFAYVHMSTFDKDKFYAVDEAIPANNFVDCNLTKLQESADPRARVLDKTELVLNANNLYASYRVDVPADGNYKLVLRYACDDEANNSLTARIHVLDKDGNKLAERITMEPTEGWLNYRAKTVDVSLKAGKQTITIQKASFAQINLSLVKLVKDVDPADKDMQTLTGTEIKKPGEDPGEEPDPDTNTPGENESFDKEVIVSDDAFKFSADDKYYAVYLDGTTKAANITDDRYVNIGDNGTSQNSYLWDGSMNYGDASGKNSFGVEGEYKALVSADKGWSGMGYNIDGSKGDLDLSQLNDDYKLHLAVKAEHNYPVDFYITDGKGRVAHMVLGQYDLDGKDPVANFKRDGKWHNVDIPLSYLRSKFGVDFRDDTDYNGNIFCASVGSPNATKIDFDAVFFYGPKDAKPNSDTPSALSHGAVTVSDERFEFSDDERYYIITLDATTKARNLTASQIVDCGPNGTTRNLYPWEGTCEANTTADANSFGESMDYMSWTQTNKGWFGLGYNVAGSNSPLNLSGLSNDYFLHFAVKTEYTGPILFTVTDAAGKSGNIVLGKEAYHDHQPLADFERDGRWHNIEVPVRLLNANDGLNFTRSANYTGNIFSVLMSGNEGSTVDYDAVFFHGPKSAPAYTTEEVPIAGISVKKATDNPFEFSDKETYYILELDSDTRRDNIQNDQIVNIGPDEQTRFLYPWSGTVSAEAATGENSFGVEGAYSSWTVGNQGWSGLGFFIGRQGLTSLAGIDKDFSLHFAVKTSTTQPVDFVVYDGNGKEAHIVLGKDKYGDNAPVGDFERDNTWYNVDVPMAWLISKGLDYRSASCFGGNVFAVMCGTKEGERIDYDAVFFHGVKKSTTGIDDVNADNMTKENIGSSVPFGIYTLQGVRVDNMSAPGIYILHTAEGTKKIMKR